MTYITPGRTLFFPTLWHFIKTLDWRGVLDCFNRIPFGTSGVVLGRAAQHALDHGLEQQEDGNYKVLGVPGGCPIITGEPLVDDFLESRHAASPGTYAARFVDLVGHSGVRVGVLTTSASESFAQQGDLPASVILYRHWTGRFLFGVHAEFEREGAKVRLRLRSAAVLRSCFAHGYYSGVQGWLDTVIPRGQKAAAQDILPLLGDALDELDTLVATDKLTIATPFEHRADAA